MNLTLNMNDAYSRLFERHARLASVRPLIEQAAAVGAMVGLYVLCERGLRRLGHLPEQGYGEPIIARQLIAHAFSRPLLFIAAASVSVAFVIALRLRWSDFARGQALRGFITIVAGISVWTHATSDVNLYFNQVYLIDRLLLIVLAAGVVWRPAFVLPFLWLLFGFLWQYDYPLITQYPWTDMNMLLAAMALMGAFVVVRMVAGFRNTDIYLFVLVCIIASFYWGSGLGKAELNWISHPHLNYLIGGAYANGWLSFMPATTIAAIALSAAPMALPLMLFTLVVEWGSVLILARRWTTLAFIAGFICFHLGVFAFTGMLFWKWIVLEVVLVALFFAKRAQMPAIYGPGWFMLSVLLIAISALWVRPVNLSWYDTRAAYVFGYRGIAKSGRVYELPIQTFTPYADMFTLGIFEYINPKPQLLHIWNVTVNREVASRLVQPIDANAFFAYEEEKNIVHYDAGRAALFDKFMQQTMRHLNARGSKASPFSFAQPPAHLWTLPRSPIFSGQEELVRVEVYQRTWLLSEGDMRIIRERPIREVAIPAN